MFCCKCDIYGQSRLDLHNRLGDIVAMGNIILLSMFVAVLTDFRKMVLLCYMCSVV